MEQTPEAQSGAAAAAQQSSPPKSPTHHQPPYSLPPSTIPSNSPNPNPNASSSLPLHRPWEPQTQYRHFTPPSTSTPVSGMAIGTPTPASFSSLNPNSYGQRYVGLARGPLESSPSTSAPQVRPPIQGNQGMGMRGPMGLAPPRAGGIVMQHQQRPVQSSVRPQTNPSNQPVTSQNLQGHGMSRGPAVGSPGVPPPGTSQSMLTHNQPWLSSGPSSRPPIPNAQFRAPMTHTPSLQQRSHIPQQHHHSVSVPSQRAQPPPSSSSPHVQQSSSEGTQENHGQQIPHTRASQQQISKSSGSGNQKLVASTSLPSTVPISVPDRTESPEIVETCNRLISKRSIQELVTQIDPSEKLDPEVEDILVDIAEDFVESITTSACSLAKHRKSTTLEAKDILLHLDRNWNMTLPGFTGDEIKCYKKPSVNDLHKERLAVIRKSVAAGDIGKSSTGQAAGGAKGHSTKATELAQP